MNFLLAQIFLLVLLCIHWMRRNKRLKEQVDTLKLLNKTIVERERYIWKNEVERMVLSACNQINLKAVEHRYYKEKQEDTYSWQ